MGAETEDRGDTSAQDPPPVSSADDVTELQHEVVELRARLDARRRRARRILTLRRVVAAVLVFVAALGLTASVVGVWAGRTALNTDRWVETVTPLQEDPEVRAAVSAYVSAELFAALDVEQRLTEVLPPQATFLAVPLSQQVRGFLHDAVTRVLESPRFAELWPQINRAAHEQVVGILTGESTVVQRQGDTAVLNLLPVLNQVLQRLEQAVPTIFGKDVSFPTVTSGDVPDVVRSRLEDALGVTLPADFGQVVIFRGAELAEAQDAVVVAKRGLLLLVGGSLLLLALALWISPQRRRTVLQLGIWLAVWVVVLTKVLRAVRDRLLDGVPEGVMQDGAAAAVHVVFSSLRERGTQVLWLGVAMAAIAYLVGPGRLPVSLRHGVVDVAQRGTRGARRLAAVAVADGPRHLHTHLDVYRVGGIAVAALVAFVLPSWGVLFAVVVLLGAYELAVTLIAASVEDAEPEEPAEGTAEGAAETRGTVPGQGVPSDSETPAGAGAGAG